MAGNNAFRVRRRATARLADGRSEPADLAEWRDVGAYLLLADPGAGKTEAFKTEALSTGAQYLTARDFVTLLPSAQWREATLFIDALDEMRAGSTSMHAPLDAIRRRLDELGRPNFRLACREADWIAAVDADALRAVVPSGDLIELRLEPLSESDIRTLLRHWPDRVPDADAFWQEAERRHIEALLANPLMLELVVDAVRGTHWPETRRQTYQLACARLATEHNPQHRASRGALAPRLEERLTDAGLLYAVQLLAGAQAWTLAAEGSEAAADIPVETMPSALGLDAPDTVLASKLFVADGERRLPRHRTVAEFLAAKAIALRITEGLPISRVLALMSGIDGGIVEPLRGLHAWLAVHCLKHRATLIDRDPLGVVLYGDVRDFESSDKRRILLALGREAQRFAWFRNGDWASHPFGALGTADMIAQFEALLAEEDRSPAHQSLIDCVLDAIRHGDELPALKQALARVLRDGSYRDSVRSGALRAWLAQSQPDLSMARLFLDDIRSGAIDDPRDELSGQLLDALYPAHLEPSEVMRYFHLPLSENFGSSYLRFWDTQLVVRTPADKHAVLADRFAELPIDRSNLNAVLGLSGFIGQIITAALHSSGEQAQADRIYAWLHSGIDEYGFDVLKGADGESVRDWLSEHPAIQKAVFAYALKSVLPNHRGEDRHFWPCEQLLYHARRPPDWFQWLLEQAAMADAEDLALYCFDNAAHAAINPSIEFTVSMDDLEYWVDAQKVRWPQAAEWLTRAWSMDLDHWQGKHSSRQREYAIKQVVERQRRYRDLAPHRNAVRAGTAPAGLMHQLALAYRDRFTDIRGETPEARIQDYLGDDAALVVDAITGLEASLTRQDLPAVADILTLGFEQREHFIRPACLVGAELATHRDPNAALTWTEALAGRLVAFWLTDGTGDMPAWYRLLARRRPGWVAVVLGAYARQHFRKRPDQSVTGLWSLSQDDDHRELARAVLPDLLQTFPVRANVGQLRQLNQDLLPAAVRHLDRRDLAAMGSRRLALKSLDAGQRIAWLVAAMALDADARSHELLEFVGSSQTRALQLAGALVSQKAVAGAANLLAPAVLLGLTLLLAPHTSPDYADGASRVGDAEHRRDLVHGLVRRLSAIHEDSAAAALAELRAAPVMKPWAAVLDAAIVEQARSLRAARFTHASASAVALTLANLAPAGASDLLALALDQLGMLAGHLSGDETNSLRLFWRDDGSAPKVENECRDVLLALLRPGLLPHAVQIEKEASAANDTRADLRVSCVADGHRVVLPIEIKKEDHRALWTAWHDQLDGSYTTDPAAQGMGIYLVLWFGHRPRKSPEGLRAHSARDLETALRACIPPSDRLRLAVIVLDLSSAGLTARPLHAA